jgi:hypothetical protein
MRALKIIGGALLAMGTAGCVSTALPPGTLVEPGYGPPPPAVYGPPPARRCWVRPGPFGPERVCRRVYY